MEQSRASCVCLLLVTSFLLLSPGAALVGCGAAHGDGFRSSGTCWAMGGVNKDLKKNCQNFLRNTAPEMTNPYLLWDCLLPCCASPLVCSCCVFSVPDDSSPLIALVYSCLPVFPRVWEWNVKLVVWSNVSEIAWNAQNLLVRLTVLTSWIPGLSSLFLGNTG